MLFVALMSTRTYAWTPVVGEELNLITEYSNDHGKYSVAVRQAYHPNLQVYTQPGLPHATPTPQRPSICLRPGVCFLHSALYPQYMNGATFILGRRLFKEI